MEITSKSNLSFVWSIALSRFFLPTKHHGHTVSELTSIWMCFLAPLEWAMDLTNLQVHENPCKQNVPTHLHFLSNDSAHLCILSMFFIYWICFAVFFFWEKIVLLLHKSISHFLINKQNHGGSNAYSLMRVKPFFLVL